VGKSSILKAYELVMSDGSNMSRLSIEDFPGGKIDPDNLLDLGVNSDYKIS
jgi:putative ATP-dependent endonuclease of OLD family